MSKDVYSHLRLPMESRLGTFDAFPLHIWRNEERTELRIVPSERAAYILRQDAPIFRCTLSSAISECTAWKPGVIDLRIDRTLLNTNDRITTCAAGCTPIPIDDAVVSELAVAVMTTLPLGSHSFYTTLCIAKMLFARLVHLQDVHDHTNACAFEEWQLSALMEALNEPTDECVSVAQIARRCRLSVCHFSRLFKATFGMPLHRYRVNQRIKEAKTRLVDSNDPISQIALDCGFADQSSFTRRFTAISGVSPGMWRRKATQEPVLSNGRGCLPRLANA